MSQINRRAKRDFKEVQRNYQESKDKSIFLRNLNPLYDRFVARIRGPRQTPYQSGKFILRIVLDADYPASPPEVRFLTHVWHPNIHPCKGYICLDILAERWTPELSLRTMLLSIQALMSAPEPDDPLSLPVGLQCKNQPEEFRATAQFWTYIYARGRFTVYEYQQKLATFVSLGVQQDLALTLLANCHWNLEEAIDTHATVTLINSIPVQDLEQ
ncbi:PREDICTED: ubiquitin-conjugating enzyme E2-22 kDa-like [Papilio xuthus]|uniref:Ubiquitin-conjugating enzyme E2 K n=1 Tax=Papilio xuthus TaxID=66420 RepID=A0A194PRN1_PAPXU|nr:PREDICTED: ubiquitin-conjugating enzyme E2-22 kDa-like [Papilio xuthus]KPI96106.1 Ubiquitin-conjugating enzyme E2 K [Papilio xuthus]